MKRLLIVGAGGHGRSVAEAVLAAGKYNLVGFADDAAPALQQVWDLPVSGTTADLARYREYADAAGFELATVVHSHAMVSPRAVIGAGCAIMAGAIVGAEAQLGVGVIVNCGAVVDHDCRVDDFCHLGVNAAMSGGSVLGRGAWMQAGCVLGYGAMVDAWRVLGSGEAVNKSINRNGIQ